MRVDGSRAVTDDPPVDFGAAVRQELKNQGHNQEWLARTLDVDRATVSRMLDRSPTLKEVSAIASALGLAPADLLRAADYIGETVTVEDLIAGDVSLTAEAREMLLAGYRTAKKARPRPRTSRRPRKAPSPDE